MAYEDARMRAARLFREAVTRDPSLYKEFAPKFQTVGLDISMGAPKGWTLPAMPDTTPSAFGDRNMPRARPDMPPGFTATDDPYLARQNMPPPASGLAPDAPFMANPAVAAGAMQPASSLYPGFAQAPERERATGSSFSGLTRRRLDANALAPLQQLTPGAPPPPMAGAGPPSPLAQAGGPSPLTGAGPPPPMAGMGPPSPIVGRTPLPSTMPGSETMGPPSPLASRFGDNSQLASGAFSGGQPRPPSPIAGMMGPPSPLASRFGDRSQLPGGAFTGGAPPPMAGGPTPQQLEAARDQVRQMAALPSVPPPKSLQPIETTPTSTMPNPLQRQPLDLAAGVGAPKLPLGSTNMPFAGMPRASVAERTADVLGPLPPGAGTGISAKPVEAPLGTTTRGLPPAPEVPVAPPAGTPTMIASMPPVNVQSVGLDQALALSGTAPPSAITPTTAPRGKGAARQAPAAPAPEASTTPKWRNAPNLGTYAGAAAGGLVSGIPGALAGATLGRGIGKIVQMVRSGKASVDENGNIIDKAGNILGRAADLAGSAGRGMGGIFGGGGSSLSGGGGMGGWGGSGGWGGGSSYTGGGYGGNAGGNINQGVGQRFGQR